MTKRSNDTRKPLFDTLRSMMKRGFRQSEVERIDAAIDQVIDRPNTTASGVPVVKRQTVLSEDGRARKVGPNGIALIKKFEGCARLRRDGLVAAYPDPGTGGAPWTIGWGATRRGLHGFVEPTTVWTQAQCDERLEDDLKRYAADVARALGKAPVTQAQFDAMVSFHYNTGAITRASLTKKHIAGDYDGAAAEFARWNKAGGRVLKGLVRRRRDETALYRDQ